MPGSARQTFNHMLIPTIVAGIWTYGYFESISARTLRTRWSEGGVVFYDNPYTAPIPPRLITPPVAEGDERASEEDVDVDDAWVANAAG